MTKAHILQEIRRTAQSNSGLPLGQEKFSSETGIKVPDWRGRYWVRWSEAIVEAGLAPNQFGTAKYDDTALLEKYALLARELGHLPVHGELLIKRKNDPEFPGTDALMRRFGTKGELIRKLAEHCRRRSGYENVVQWCEDYSPRKQDAVDAADPGELEMGFVYLMKSGRFYKIGKSNSAGRRHYEISLEMPERVAKVHEIRTDDPSGIEAYWHNRFAPKRKNGEWFDLNSTDVAAFKRRKFM